jgi:lysozyme family protein
MWRSQKRKQNKADRSKSIEDMSSHYREQGLQTNVPLWWIVITTLLWGSQKKLQTELFDPFL